MNSYSKMRVKALKKVLADQMGKVFEALAINQKFSLPALIGNGAPVDMMINSRISQIICTPTINQAGGILFAMDASVTSEKMVNYTPLGSIGRAGCLVPGAVEVFNHGQKFPLEIGLAEDFINQLLFSLWNAGSMVTSLTEADIGDSFNVSSFGVSDLKITTDFMLPPVMTSCVDDGSNKLQMGDLHLHAQLKLNDQFVDIWLWVTLQATVKLSAVADPKAAVGEFTNCL